MYVLPLGPKIVHFASPKLKDSPTVGIVNFIPLLFTAFKRFSKVFVDALTFGKYTFPTLNEFII